MELTLFKSKLPNWVKKYKYALLVLLLGVVLLLIPTGEETAPEVVATQAQSEAPSMEEQLAQILSTIDGAGEVRVMLTVAAGEEVLYQTNDSNSVSQEGSDCRSDTVIVTDSDRSETGLIRQVNPPLYRGAIIVCQGADNPSVRLFVTEAVSKITGLGTDKISVLKMK